MNGNIIKNLMDFIDAAEKSRKYPGNTASARRSAVRLFEHELNEQEKASLDTLKKNLDQIYTNVFNKNKSNMTVASLETYKNRFIALVKEYEKYGINPTMMANWNRPIRKISTKDDKTKNNVPENMEVRESEYKEIEMSRFELPLRPGIKAIILVPSNITRDEVNKVRKYIDFLDSIASEPSNNEVVMDVENKENI
ncbi:MAG: hypothetical protein UR81_C0024G0009 [Candidatus Levybacteria bacterium GW2011_GWB1_35_5]|nr:MAG: hypothetical protein UR81_C0024G0009 [Candidatus Levybacteria bacterium GW2011_GWB1_35_5]